MTRRIHYRTRLQVPQKGWLFLVIPNDVLGVRKRVWLRGTLDGKPFAATADPWRDDTHVVVVSRSMRALLGVDGETEVTVDAEVLEEPVLDLPVPDDLAEAMAAEPVALATFEALPPSHQKEFMLWLDEARRPSTRALRVAKSVEVLARGRHLWEDPRRRLADDLR